MALPCLSCGKDIGLDLTFIIKNPISKCPFCDIILNFTVDKDIRNKFSKALSDIEDIKKKYEKTTNFK
jgi:hypothetical protein